MPTQKTDTLTALVAHSLLLTPSRKGELLAALPALTGKQEKELRRILKSEDDVLNDLAKQAITRAVEKRDKEFLDELEVFLSDALRRLRRAEEGAERGSETEHTEHLFDDAL